MYVLLYNQNIHHHVVFIFDLCYTNMHIRKAHILIRHFFNTNDDSAGIFFAEEEGGLDWLWSAIEQTVSLFNNDVQEFRRLGGDIFFLSNGSHQNLTTDPNGVSSGVV